MTIIHAFSAYYIDAETLGKEECDTLNFHWYSNEFAETAALVNYRRVLEEEKAQGDELAAALYRIELDDAEIAALVQEHNSRRDPDQDGDLFAVMEVIEWDRNWLHPGVTVVDQTDTNRRWRERIAAEHPSFTVAAIAA